MYKKILVTLDTTSSDAEILAAVASLASLMKSELLLLHVADGWVARNFHQLNLAESEEMRADWKYLEDTAEKLRGETGLGVTTQLALGNPPDQILKVAQDEGVDLIAMASHGHGIVGDILRGSTIESVRHRARIPMLIVPPPPRPGA
ncbi:MAG: universal stress protein [Verrucomicrobiaceae bacterium]|nr:universal stress protein [Verrucomicrobiaceae bacterium]